MMTMPTMTAMTPSNQYSPKMEPKMAMRRRKAGQRIAQVVFGGSGQADAVDAVCEAVVVYVDSYHDESGNQGGNAGKHIRSGELSAGEFRKT